MNAKTRQRTGRAPQGTLSNWVITALAAGVAVAAIVLRAVA